VPCQLLQQDTWTDHGVTELQQFAKLALLVASAEEIVRTRQVRVHGDQLVQIGWRMGTK